MEYQVIWCPKYRRRVIGGGVGLRGKRIICEVGTEAGGQVIQWGRCPSRCIC